MVWTNLAHILVENGHLDDRPLNGIHFPSIAPGPDFMKDTCVEVEILWSMF